MVPGLSQFQQMVAMNDAIPLSKRIRDFLMAAVKELQPMLRRKLRQPLHQTHYQVVLLPTIPLRNALCELETMK